MCWDDCAEPLDSGSGRPVDQVLLHVHNGLQWRLQHLMRGVEREVSSRTREEKKEKKQRLNCCYQRPHVINYFLIFFLRTQEEPCKIKYTGKTSKLMDRIFICSGKTKHNKP